MCFQHESDKDLFVVQDELLQEHMNQMRSKFKTIVTLLGLQQEHLATGHADIDSAAPDTSF